MARRYGATDDELATLGDPDREPLSPAERAAVRFAEDVTLRHQTMNEDNIAALGEHFTPEQMVELMCVAGLFNYLNRFSIAFGLWPTREGEGGPEDRGGK